MAVAESAADAVVVGVDGSPTSEQALLWAADQAHLMGRPLTLLHACGAWSPAGEEMDAETLLAAMRAEGRTVLRRAADLVEERRPGLKLRSELVVADPRSALLEASERAELIVLGSRGRGTVASLLLGSVGVALTRHATCPVVVRRPHDEPGAPRGILVAVDSTPQSEAALEWAFRQADLRSEPLTLLHAVFDGLPAGPIGRDEPPYDHLWGLLDRAAAAYADRFDVDVTLRVQRGLAVDAIVGASSEVDMVVLGAHLQTSLLGLLDDNVPKQVLERAPCYVVVVPAARMLAD